MLPGVALNEGYTFMAIVSKIQKAKKLTGNKFCRRNMRKLKQIAHRQYRRTAKHAMKSGREINEKPRLTAWHII
jgi:hypothetical protein